MALVPLRSVFLGDCFCCVAGRSASHPALAYLKPVRSGCMMRAAPQRYLPLSVSADAGLLVFSFMWVLLGQRGETVSGGPTETLICRCAGLVGAD